MRHADATGWRQHHGLTLLEMVVALLVVALLTTLAHPSFRAQWLKARRGDARVALMQLQQAQERWRADHPAYAGALELGVPDRSPHGHYRLGVHAASASGYELHAVADGPQRADVPCTVLRVRYAQAEISFLSGPSADTANPESANRGCWNR